MDRGHAGLRSAGVRRASLSSPGGGFARCPVCRTGYPLGTASRAIAHFSELLDEHRLRGKIWAWNSGRARMRACQTPVNERILMPHSVLVYAANPERHLIAVTGDRGFTILDLDSGPAEIGDTLSSDDEGIVWFNSTRRVRLVAYQRQRGVRANDLRQCLFSKT